MSAVKGTCPHCGKTGFFDILKNGDTQCCYCWRPKNLPVSLKEELQDEASDLNKKISKIENFIMTSSEYHKLSKEHKTALIEQHTHMQYYLKSLVTRIQLEK